MDELQKKMTKLEKQYQELAESSIAAITSLAEQRRKLRVLIRRIVEMGPDIFDDIDEVHNLKSKKLVELLKDCQEVL